MRKPTWITFILLMLAFTISGIPADDVVVLKLRLYQGVRNSGRIDQGNLDSYTLKKIADTCILSDDESGREKSSIIKIYNLKYAHYLYKLGMLLKKGALVQTKHGLLLNKRKMNLQVGYLVEKPDLFKVGILPLGKDKEPLLMSKLIIPGGKTAVLGFEDSEGKAFFLAINRVDKLAVKSKDQGKTVEFPKLISRSAPSYPPDALVQDISGVVILECHTDLLGKVNRIHVIEGPMALAEPARADVLKWKYSPWKINGRVEPVRMHLIIFYTIIENSNRSIDTSEKAILEALEKYKPMIRKWQTTYPVSEENQAILEIIIAEGKK